MTEDEFRERVIKLLEEINDSIGVVAVEIGRLGSMESRVIDIEEHARDAVAALYPPGDDGE